MKLKRNRIVIPLDQAQAGQKVSAPGGPTGPKKSRAGKILGIIALLLILIVVGIAAGGYFWWRNYQAKPAYSLALLVDASQRNDTAEVDRRLDMDKITDNFISQVRARVTGGSALAALVPSQIDQAIAGLAPKVKPTVHDQLTREIQRLTGPAAGKPFPLIAIAVPYFVNIKQDGQTATAETKVQDEQIKLTMHADASDRWQIVAVEDDKLIDIIAESIKKAIAESARKDLPKSASQWQDELERRLKDLKLPGTSQ